LSAGFPCSPPGAAAAGTEIASAATAAIPVILFKSRDKTFLPGFVGLENHYRRGRTGP
jgi:hypothetical protein